MGRMRANSSVVILPILLSALSDGFPTAKVSNESLPSAMLYLMKYGYMEVPSPETRSAQILSPDGLLDYILEFQAFAGLPRTGVLDARTIEMMNTPRCGVKDFIGPGSGAKRKKRYALQGSRWKVKELTYKISKYPSDSDLTRSQVDAEIKKALSVWSDHTDLKFIRKRSGKVHIDVRFEKKEHGDGDPFDGSGGTLAHAFFPVFGGDAPFDDDEPWTINSYRGTSLLQTAAHEFGHSLGLSHTDDKQALMAPFYRGFEQSPKLEKDDIRAIQALYGKKSSEDNNNVIPNTVQKDEEEDTDNELCKNAKVD